MLFNDKYICPQCHSIIDFFDKERDDDWDYEDGVCICGKGYKFTSKFTGNEIIHTLVWKTELELLNDDASILADKILSKFNLSINELKKLKSELILLYLTGAEKWGKRINKKQEN